MEKDVKTGRVATYFRLSSNIALWIIAAGVSLIVATMLWSNYVAGKVNECEDMLISDGNILAGLVAESRWSLAKNCEYLVKFSEDSKFWHNQDDVVER